jgi:lipopolysaccharide biosynthesis regulator YciM
MRKAVAAFEDHSDFRPGQPDWGHAEALCDLGQMVYARGDRTAARDWLERALVVTPDYVAAQALLQKVAAAR